MGQLSVYVIGEASSKQQPISKVFGHSKVRCRFWALLGSAPLKLHIFQGLTV